MKFMHKRGPRNAVDKRFQVLEASFNAVADQVAKVGAQVVMMRRDSGKDADCPPPHGAPVPTQSTNAKRANVGEALDKHEATVSGLFDRLNALEDRLSRVLDSRPPDGTASGSTPTPTSIFGRVTQTTQALHIANLRIENMLDRLEV